MIKTSLIERLEWLDRNLVKYSERIILEEKADSGKAKLDITFPQPVIAFTSADKRMLGYFNKTRCADAIIFEQTGQSNCHLHIFEFKKTVNASAWLDIKEQFQGALKFATALMGVLGVRKVNKVLVYTAFRKDDISNKQNANIALNKVPVGGRTNPYSSVDWVQDEVVLDVVDIPIRHTKVQLNESGEGELSLIESRMEDSLINETNDIS